MTKTYMGMPVVLDETFDPDRWDIVRTPQGEEFIEVSQKVFDLLQDEHPWCLACGRSHGERAGTADSDVNVLGPPFCWACGLNEYGQANIQGTTRQEFEDYITQKQEAQRKTIEQLCDPGAFGMACVVEHDVDEAGQEILPTIPCPHRIYYDPTSDNLIAVRPRLDGTYADAFGYLVREQS